jgi:hypothetical protein
MTILNAGQDIYIRKGDTGNITFSGLPTDKAYSVYISVYNPDTSTIIKEILHTTFAQATGVVLFKVDEDTSNSLPVGEWEYGLKICASDGSEDTVLPRIYVDETGSLIQEAAPKFIVLDKYVEGE